MLLAADVGGTNARVALFEHGDSKPRVVEKYRTAAWDGVPSILAEFVATHPVPLTGACVAVAGPARGESIVLQVGDALQRELGLDDLRPPRLTMELAA